MKSKVNAEVALKKKIIDKMILNLFEVHTDQQRARLSENLAFGRRLNNCVTRTSNRQTRKQRKWLRVPYLQVLRSALTSAMEKLWKVYAIHPK